MPPGTSNETEELVGFIDHGDSGVSGLIDDTLSGNEPSAEEIDTADRLIENGPRLEISNDILGLENQIQNDYDNQSELLTHGFTQVDSNGDTWQYDPYSGGFDHVTTDSESALPTLEPTPDKPPFQEDLSSGSIFAEPEDDL